MKVESLVSDERGLCEGLCTHFGLEANPGLLRAHNKFLGFIDKGENLAFWFGTVGSVWAGEVGRQISFASHVLQADLVLAYGSQKGRHAWTSGEYGEAGGEFTLRPYPAQY